MSDSTVETVDTPDRRAGQSSAVLASARERQVPVLDRQKKLLSGVGAQIYLVLFVGVLLTLGASLVAYYSFREILHHESYLSENSMPNLIDSVEVTRRSSEVVGVAFRLLASDSSSDHAIVAASMIEQRELLESTIEELESRSVFDESTRLIRNHLAELTAHLEAIRDSSGQRLVIRQELEKHGEELADLNRSMTRILVEALDNQGFYLVEGMRTLDDVPHRIEQRASEEELTIYRNLTSLNHQINLAVLLLDEVMVISDRQFLPPLQERFHSAYESSRSIFEKLSGFQIGDLQGNSLVQQLGRIFGAEEQRHFSLNLMGDKLRSLGEIGEGRNGIIPLRWQTLQRLEDERNELEKAQNSSIMLITEVNNLVTKIKQDALGASAASRASVKDGILWLVIINVMSAGIALLFAWFFVWRYLIRRLVGLAGAMHQIAGGDLKVPVEVKGNDELTDMAMALEVFRRNAEEVQRLNLVEKLAEELDVRNESLERAMKDLQKAQEQIVAEQKLASLGQLTAGVAHEIKNPLNFIGNFSVVANELVDEIKELFEDEKEANPEVFKESELAEEIESVIEEVKLSLGKITEHSKRANGVVQSMLEHSRSGESEEYREVDLNAMLKQYVELAYHALRAEDSNFNTAIVEDLDPEAAMLEVVPQDISRVFLNLATNACQAINERRQNYEKDWKPELKFSSRRLDDHVRFCIRDNGTGIPENLKKQIFEPFVTTKPPGQGTGLGLSLTSDVIIRHGGSIDLDSEEGSFTEMCILLPLQRPSQGKITQDNVSDED